MEELFQTIASYVGLMLESMVVITVAIGSLEALYRIVRAFLVDRADDWNRRAVWLRFAGWILISLEFALGADIVRSAIAPSWDDVGKLGAIAVIRTFLGFFLGKDLETVEDSGGKAAEPAGERS